MEESLRGITESTNQSLNTTTSKKKGATTLPEHTSPPSHNFTVPKWLQVGAEKSILALGTVACGAIAIGIFPVTLIGLGLKKQGEAARLSDISIVDDTLPRPPKGNLELLGELLSLPLTGVKKAMTRWEELDNELAFNRMNQDSRLKTYCEDAIKESPTKSYKKILQSIQMKVIGSKKGEERDKAMEALKEHAPFLFIDTA